MRCRVNLPGTASRAPTELSLSSTTWPRVLLMPRENSSMTTRSDLGMNRRMTAAIAPARRPPSQPMPTSTAVMPNAIVESAAVL